MRKLITNDVFTAFAVIKEIGVKDELAAMADKVKKHKDNGKSQEEIGLEFIMGILGNCGTQKARDAVYKCLSGPMEIPAEEIGEMDLFDFANLVKELVALIDVDEWHSFFTSVGSLLKRS